MRRISLVLWGCPPPARVFCCRTTRSLRRFGLCCPRITMTAIEPADDIEAVTEILAHRVSSLGSPVWLSLFDGPGSSPTMASDSDSSSSASPHSLRPPWGRPRTLSLDTKLSTRNGCSGPLPAPRTRGPSHSSSSSSSSGSPNT